MSSGIVIFGADSVFSAEAMETVRRLDMTIVAAVLTGEPEWDLAGLEDVLEEADLDEALLTCPVVVPWVTPALRRERVAKARAVGFTSFATLVDPASSIASTAAVASGCYINAQAAVGSHAKLEESVLLNRNSSVGHHTVLESFASIGPGANVAARCRVGSGAFIATGAAVAPGVRVGANSVVGLGSAVIEEVPEGTLVAGTPARHIRSLHGQEMADNAR